MAIEQDKLDVLKRISSEERFREAVLVSLLRKMGFIPVLTHGAGERGKDIVCSEDNQFGLTEWIAIVAKVGKITGATSGVPSSFQTILNQVQECFAYPYTDPQQKKPCSINKVFVVTTDEILDSAKQKIVEKLGRPGAADANVHFISGQQIVPIIDKHWPDFWSQSELLIDAEDRMSEDAGLVLYVLARASVLSKAEAKKQVPREMTLNELQRSTRISLSRVEDALTYLVRSQYVETNKRKKYTLHHRQTVGKLLTDGNQIRLLFALKEIANGSRRFTLEKVYDVGQRESLKFTKQFINKTLLVLRTGRYISDDESRGRGNFDLNLDMVTEEQPYLQRWLDYQGLPPKQAD